MNEFLQAEKKEESPENFMKARSVVLTDIKESNSQYPGIALDSKGKKYMCVQEYRNRHDVVYAGWIEDGEIKEKTQISGAGEALRPVIQIVDDVVWYAWSECIDRVWYIMSRYYKNGTYSPVITVAEGEALFYPAFFVENGRLALLFNEQAQKSSKCVLYYLSEEGVSEKEVVSQEKEVYRPTGCQGGDGNTYVVYDCFRNDRYDGLVRVKVNGQWLDEVKFNDSDFWVSRPIVTAALTGATVCWYEFGRMAVFSYCTADLSVKDGKAVCENVQKLSTNVHWYHDVASASNKKGTTVFAYTWGKYNINVRHRLAGGEWSEPVVMFYNDTHCAVHPAVFVDEEDNIHLLWQYAHKNGHLDRNGCIVYNAMNVNEMAPYFDKVVENGIDYFEQPIPTEKEFPRRTDAEVAAWLKKNGYGDKKLVFGDIHGQSGISDGEGEIDQYYHFARTIADLDFTALTDHDCYPDWISQSEWEWMRTTNKLMNVKGELASLLAYEWTPNEYKYDYGHKNVYYRGDDGDIFRSGDIGGMTPFKLFESVKQYGAMAFPHHPAADWGLVSAATDWNFHDPEVQRLVEIYSRHANFEDYESRSKYTKNISKLEGHSVQDALARKYHIGVTAGSDSHQMEHGIEGGIFATFVPELTREEVFDALYDRFTYATTGARILMSFKCGSSFMGQEVEVKRGDSVLLDVSVMGICKGVVQIIKNGEVVAEKETPDGICDFSFEDKDWRTDDYYYAKIVQEDEHMAWSSPIWVKER